MALRSGTLAPDFTLPATGGTDFTLSRDAAGKLCILYFYPKDFTPGCTEEACSFRERFDFFEGLDVPIYGISRDDVASHERFKAEHNLPFDLLADEDGSVGKAYEAFRPLIRVPRRITYLIDAERRIAAVYENFFGARSHIEEMIQALEPKADAGA